jgi:hypothetical protein
MHRTPINSARRSTLANLSVVVVANWREGEGGRPPKETPSATTLARSQVVKRGGRASLKPSSWWGLGATHNTEARCLSRGVSTSTSNQAHENANQK